MNTGKGYFEILATNVQAMNAWKLGGFMLVFLYLNNLTWSVLAQLITGTSLFTGTEQVNNRNWYETVLVIPLFETLIFQFLVLHCLLKYLPAWIAVILSGFVFSAMHYYNPAYMMATLLPGLGLAIIVYAKGYLGGNKLLAISLVFLIHSLNNWASYLFRSI